MRNLSAAEIVAQVVTARTVLGWDCRNVVFMGMGEPLDNLGELARALRVLTDQRGLRYPAERLTVCTAGHAEGIRGLRALGLRRMNLSVSLNAADDATRDRLMPVNRRTDLAALAAALAAYPQRRSFVLGVNYCLLPGINDSREDARGVAAWCAKVGRAYVNLIPYNPGTQPLCRAPTPEEIGRFLGVAARGRARGRAAQRPGRLDHGRLRAARRASRPSCTSAGPRRTVIPRSERMPSVLITGANGFIGSNLCRHFLDRGWEVHGLVRPSSDLHFLEGLPVRLITGDLLEAPRIDFPERVDAIIHSASVVSDIVGLEWSIRGIYDPTVRFVEALRAAGVSFDRFVYISTTLVLGWHGFNISEERPGHPTDRIPYAQAKRKTEQFLLEEHRRAGLPAVILRPADVYGPNDRTSLAMMLEGIEGGISPIVGTGRHRFSYCYVDNLCQACRLVAEGKGSTGAALHGDRRRGPDLGPVLRRPHAAARPSAVDLLARDARVPRGAGDGAAAPPHPVLRPAHEHLPHQPHHDGLDLRHREDGARARVRARARLRTPGRRDRRLVPRGAAHGQLLAAHPEDEVT